MAVAVHVALKARELVVSTLNLQVAQVQVISRGVPPQLENMTGGPRGSSGRIDSRSNSCCRNVVSSRYRMSCRMSCVRARLPQVVQSLVV